MGLFLQLLLLAVGALVLGAFGSAWIARNRRGIRAAASYLLLTAVPYIAVIAMIAVSIDPTLSSRQAQYDGEFAFALFVIVFTVPWAVACLIGAVIGRRGRERPNASARPAPVAPAPAQPAPGAPGDGPDWRHPDSPLLSVAQLDARIRAIAERHGYAAERLPQTNSLAGGDGRFIARDKFDYIYGEFQRSQIIGQYLASVADEICYKVFAGLAYEDAIELRAAAPLPDVPFVVQVRSDLDKALAAIDPRWAVQAAFEQAYNDSVSV